MRRRSCGVVCVAVLAIASVSGARAQWLIHAVPGTPRLADGKPNLRAPMPRTADGKPDLSGVWAAERNRPPGAVGSGFVGNRHGENIAVDVPGGAPLTDWARTLLQQRRTAEHRPIPTERCLPSGIPPDMLRPQLPFKVIQTASVVVILIEEFSNWRQVHLDGRTLPEDPQPAFYGYSVGRWDGDALVVTTAGFNDKTWLDGSGMPHSEELIVTERIRRTDFGRLDISYTFDDAQAFTKPWSATVKFELQPDTELLDHQCENDRWQGGSAVRTR
jgi:hypothetical protein